jgi:hypothetical protein
MPHRTSSAAGLHFNLPFYRWGEICFNEKSILPPVFDVNPGGKVTATFEEERGVHP